jgi:hypothetical protein
MKSSPESRFMLRNKIYRDVGVTRLSDDPMIGTLGSLRMQHTWHWTPNVGSDV